LTPSSTVVVSPESITDGVPVPKMVHGQGAAVAVGVAGFDGFVRIDLDLVVILGARSRQAKAMRNNKIQRSKQQDSQLHQHHPL